MASFDDVLDGLLDIIAFEGPMPCRAAYQRYLDVVRLDGVPKQVISVLNRATYFAVQQRLLIDRDEWGTLGQRDRIVRLADDPPLIARERGDRLLQDIPPSEVAAGLLVMADGDRSLVDVAPELCAHALLAAYGLERRPGFAWQDAVVAQALTHFDFADALGYVVRSP